MLGCIFTLDSWTKYFWFVFSKSVHAAAQSLAATELTPNKTAATALAYTAVRDAGIFLYGPGNRREAHAMNGRGNGRKPKKNGDNYSTE
jgi:hypothetical protein